MPGITISRVELCDFIEIRNTGRFGNIIIDNMFSPVVAQVLALSKEEHLHIIKNFDDLCKKLDIDPETGEVISPEIGNISA